MDVSVGSPMKYHFIFNFTGFVVAFLLLWPGLEISSLLHRVLGSLYLFSMTIGCSTVILFCKDHCYGLDIDGAFTITTSFVGMAASVLVPGYIGLYRILVNKNYKSHSEWMLRSYVATWGSYFFFRILLITYLPFAPNFYSGYIVVVWASWVLPLLCLEIYLDSVRNDVDLFGKHGHHE
jgi:hypothetical protein